MIRIVFIITLFVIFSIRVFSQTGSKDKGNVNFHFGTIIVYTTYSIGYESFDLIKKIEKHQLRPTVRGGVWKSTFMNKNIGTQSSLGLTYLFGKGKHFFEHSSEIISHYDKGLKGQRIVYIGSLYRPYLGYRFQPPNKKVIIKVGVGWREVIQIGFGYNL